jgi:hypothetical protein
VTPAEHQQRIRRLQFEIEKADHGLAMPYDYQRVLALRLLLLEAERQAELAAVLSDGVEQ